jgi:hypothetical protein
VDYEAGKNSDYGSVTEVGNIQGKVHDYRDLRVYAKQVVKDVTCYDARAETNTPSEVRQ